MISSKWCTQTPKRVKKLAKIVLNEHYKKIIIIFKQVLKDVTPLKKKEGIDNKLNTNLDKVKKYIKKKFIT